MNRTLVTFFAGINVVLACYSTTPNSEESNSQNETQQQTLNGDELIKKQLEIEQLEAKIKKEKDALNLRPRKKFISSKPQQFQQAAYLEKWIVRIEQVANTNYPRKAANENIYGKVMVTVSIKANGELENIEINKSSGHTILDGAVIDIVKKAAPFTPFTEKIKKDADILSITSTWIFTNEKITIDLNWFINEVEKQI